MPDQSSFRQFGLSLDEISKLLAGLVVLVYLVGYMCLTLHFYRYGFSQTSPFRPRILEAGITCLALFAVPFAIGAALGIAPRFGKSPRIAWSFKIGLLAPLWAVISSTGDGIIGPSEVPITLIHASTNKHLVLLIAIALICIAPMIAYALRSIFRMSGLTGLLITGLILLTLGQIVEATAYKGVSSRLYVWYMIVACLGIFQGYRSARETPSDPSEFEALTRLIEPKEYRRTLVGLQLLVGVMWLGAGLPILLLYSVLVLPVVPYSLGGGSPLEVTIYLTGSGMAPSSAKLLDENDSGYFATLHNSPRATFFPRDKVAAVFYGSTPPKEMTDVAKSLQKDSK